MPASIHRSRSSVRALAVVDNVFDAASRTFRVRLVLPNEDYALPAGLRCSVRFFEAADTGNVAASE